MSEPSRIAYSAYYRTKGSLLARNAFLNLIGQAVPLLVGLVTIPFIVHGLGTDRFGLLSLAWVVLGYFAVFDLGLGRATTKFAAEALGKGEKEQVPRLVWTAVIMQAVFGIVGGVVLAGATPFLVERVLNIPAELIKEASATFYVLAFSVPVVLVSGSFRGVLEASQRFDLLNVVRIPTSALTYLLPLLGLVLGVRLPGIVILILLARIGSLAAFVVLSLRLIPELNRCRCLFNLLPRLFSFGGWVMVSSIVSPLLTCLDRFLIGSLLSTSKLAYYSAPYEAVTRLGIIPTSLTMTLFPAFSSLGAIKDKERLGTLFARPIKYVLLTLGPVLVVMELFAQDIIQVWLGPQFATQSAIALRILGAGILINSLAYTPLALLQGVGRPDLPAKFHLLELPIYIGVALPLIGNWGINGAAAAWVLRVTMDAMLLFAAVLKTFRFSSYLFASNGVTVAGFMLILLAGMGLALKTVAMGLSPLLQFLLIIGLLGLFIWLSWERVLDDSDRRVIVGVMRLRKLERTAE